jgi:hypothetical protein
VASATVLLRRSDAAHDPVLDVTVSAGKEVVAVRAGGADVRGIRAVAARWERPLARGWGVALGATYHATDGFPARRGMTVGMTTRW